MAVLQENFLLGGITALKNSKQQDSFKELVRQFHSLKSDIQVFFSFLGL